MNLEDIIIQYARSFEESIEIATNPRTILITEEEYGRAILMECE